MPLLLTRSILMAVAVCLSLTAGAEPLPRRESNVSVRNEVQLAVDKGLAHLQSTQRADGTWGKVGTTGFALMAFQRDPRGRGMLVVSGDKFEDTIRKGYEGLRQALQQKGGILKMDDFASNVPPALVALRASRDPRDIEVVARARQAIGAAPIPESAEARAFFLALDPKQRLPGKMPSTPTGSALAAWLWSALQHDIKEAKYGPRAASKPAAAVEEWLRDQFTLERNPHGEGVHQYYFWLSSVLLRESPIDSLRPELKLSSGVIVDIPRQLAEKLINEQNGNGSWSGVGDHWTEKDADLVTALCLLTLEQVFGQL